MDMITLTDNPKIRQIVNIVAFVFTLVMNYLSTALPLNGRTPAEISQSLPSYFTPANYAFAIWGLIYAALLGFIVYQSLPAQRQNPHLQRIGYLFALTNLVNGAWILAWHYSYFAVSVIFMAMLLATLIAIYVRLNIGRPSEKGEPARSLADRLLIHFPFSLYLGWITVATVANFASVLPYYGWNGGPIAAPVWAAIMIVVATIVAGTLLLTRVDFAYAGVIIWALVAIAVAQSEGVVVTTAVIAAILVTLFAFVGWFRARSQRATQLRARPA
jgi:translocator protein